MKVLALRLGLCIALRFARRVRESKEGDHD
jgi:hypothetical protein